MAGGNCLTGRIVESHHDSSIAHISNLVTIRILSRRARNWAQRDRKHRRSGDCGRESWWCCLDANVLTESHLLCTSILILLNPADSVTSESNLMVMFPSDRILKRHDAFGPTRLKWSPFQSTTVLVVLGSSWSQPWYLQTTADFYPLSCLGSKIQTTNFHYWWWHGGSLVQRPPMSRFCRNQP